MDKKFRRDVKEEADASAPSEQDLKEEEELQLALALSLSESGPAPPKISFPDLTQFEDNADTPATVTPTTTSSIKTSAHTADITRQSGSSGPSGKSQNHSINPVASAEQNPQAHPDYQVYERDQELFRYVAEVQSTAEVFDNRVKSNKMRNRPIANDSAIQSLFLKLTNMHTKLLDYIKIHDEDRTRYESIQDKLSQISDARAALDALREEHQEKIRQQAAEAERLRQSQLAQKLEEMRQKKSHMMQYQREVAMQRIQAQEMMLRQPQGFPPPPNNVPQQVPPTDSLQQQQQQQQHQQMQHQQAMSLHQQQQQIPLPPPQASIEAPMFQPVQAQSQPQPHQISQPILQRPTNMPSKPNLDDEAPLISFDD